MQQHASEGWRRAGQSEWGSPRAPLVADIFPFVPALGRPWDYFTVQGTESHVVNHPWPQNTLHSRLFHVPPTRRRTE